MRYRVEIDGEAGELACEWKEPRARFAYVRAGRQPVTGEAEVREVEAGVYSVLWGDRSFEVRVSGDKGMVVIEIGSRRYSVRVSDPREMSNGAAGAAIGRQEIAAPMPGKVIRYLVKVGDAVLAGQGVVVVEAMKMQNEMQAAHAGKVAEIRAGEGAPVTAGEVLVVLE